MYTVLTANVNQIVVVSPGGLSMYSITKTFEISYAHMLPNHEGKCRNLHGHNATIAITVAGSTLINEDSSVGMLMDFGDLKKFVKKEALDILDHKTLVKGDEWIYDAALLYTSQLLEEQRDQYLNQFVVLNFETTAENLAQWCNDRLRDRILKFGVMLSEVTWYETRDNSATYLE